MFTSSNLVVRSIFHGSSMVEQPAVNRLVAGSSSARGANKLFEVLFMLLSWFRKKHPKCYTSGNGFSAVQVLDGDLKGCYIVFRDGVRTRLSIRLCEFGEFSGKYAYVVFREDRSAFVPRSRFFHSPLVALSFICCEFERIMDNSVYNRDLMKVPETL